MNDYATKVSTICYDANVFFNGDTSLTFLDTGDLWKDHIKVNVHLHTLWVELKKEGLDNLAARIADVFFQYNQRLAPGIMYRYLPSGNMRNQEDHLGAGYMGLWEAFAGTKPETVGVIDEEGETGGWSPEHGAFSTYASRHITGRIWRSIASGDEQYHSMTYGTFQKRPQVMKAYRELSRELGTRPSVKQLVAHTGLSYDVVSAALSSNPLSLDAPHGDDDTRTLHESLGETLPEETNNDMLFDVLDNKTFTETLTAEELLVAGSHFGVTGGTPQTLVGVGYLLNIDRKTAANIDKTFKNKLTTNLTHA